MIASKNLNDKTYEEMISEAVAQIPLYSREWSNYNPSEPGITILENLAAFQALQREEMNTVTEEVRFALLKLVGFTPREGNPARALLLLEKNLPKELPRRQKLYVQELCYELPENTTVKQGRITGIYVEEQEDRRDVGLLTAEYGIPGGLALFGDKPRAGQELYLCLDRLPQAGEDMIFYVKVVEDFQRNPLSEADKNPFVELSFAVYTDGGFVELKALDYTRGFLYSGGIYLKTPQNACRKEDENAYVVRITLKRAAYDIAPKVQSICGLLTEAVQTDTYGALLAFDGQTQIHVNHMLLEENLMYVYVLEEDGFYHLYSDQEEWDGGQNASGWTAQTGQNADDLWADGNALLSGAAGRHCRVRRDSKWACTVTFPDEGAFRPIPGRERGVLVSVNTRELMIHRRLGRALGYDNQQFSLEPFTDIWPKPLTVMLEMIREGRTVYQFVSPGETGPGAFSYRYLPRQHAIEILSCGDYEGAWVYLADCVLSKGAGGNVLPGNEFFIKTPERDYACINYASDVPGRDAEDVEEVRRRFVMDLNQPATMVTAADCAAVVRGIPGLSINKVTAFAGRGDNTIHVVIEPNSREEFPGLSDTYREQVNRYLTERRMMTTRVLVEAPVYIPIDVRGTIYMEKHFENGRQQIDQVLMQLLSDWEGKRRFGEVISYHEMYQRLEELECVGEIYDLSFAPQNPAGASQIGLDLKLNENCICCPGVISMELNTRHY